MINFNKWKKNLQFKFIIRTKIMINSKITLKAVRFAIKLYLRVQL